ERFAPDGLLHYGQGKWYPGEEIPRWALGCFWRSDGEAMWRTPDLLARIDKDYGHSPSDGEKFIHRLAQLAGIQDRYINPVYEDAVYYLWKEQSLPVGVDPYKANLKDGLERRRLARVLLQGLDKPVGYVLPLSWDYGAQGWYSSQWQTRTERVILIPGDSPIGLRLPLNSLPSVMEEEVEPQRDPFEERDELQLRYDRPV